MMAQSELEKLQWRTLRGLCRKAAALKKSPTAEERDLIFTILARLDRQGDYMELRKEVKALWDRINEIESLLSRAR